MPLSIYHHQKLLHTSKMGLATTVFSAVFLATGGFLFGYDSGIITSTIALDTFKEYFTNPNDTTTGGIVSAFQGGAIAGTIFNMLFAHKLGRRWTILVGALVSVFGSALQAGAVNMAMLIVGRFIGGVAVGQLTSTIPLYAAELSEAKHRGVLSGLLQWMLSWGFFVAQWLGYGCSFNSTQFSCKSLSDWANEPRLTVTRALSTCISVLPRTHPHLRDLLPTGVATLAYGKGPPRGSYDFASKAPQRLRL